MTSKFVAPTRDKKRWKPAKKKQPGPTPRRAPIITNKMLDRKTKTCFGPDGRWFVSKNQNGSWFASAYVHVGKKQAGRSNINHLRIRAHSELKARRSLFTALAGLEVMHEGLLIFVTTYDHLKELDIKLPEIK